MSKTETAMNKLIDEILKEGKKQNVFEVFNTFIELAALSLSIISVADSRMERLQRHLEICRQLDRKSIEAYGRMLEYLFEAAAMAMDEPYDILGTVFHKLDLHNKWKGQFFTPSQISRLMAEIAGGDLLPKKGFITVSDPACGSGSLLLGTVCQQKQRNLDYQHHALFVAQDIDIRCVWMCYIQMYLFRIPAIVIHGDSLAVEEWEHWYTPGIYALDFDDELEVQGVIEENKA